MPLAFTEATESAHTSLPDPETETRPHLPLSVTLFEEPLTDTDSRFVHSIVFLPFAPLTLKSLFPATALMLPSAPTVALDPSAPSADTPVPLTVVFVPSAPFVFTVPSFTSTCVVSSA